MTPNSGPGPPGSDLSNSLLVMTGHSAQLPSASIRLNLKGTLLLNQAPVTAAKGWLHAPPAQWEVGWCNLQPERRTAPPMPPLTTVSPSFLSALPNSLRTSSFSWRMRKTRADRSWPRPSCCGPHIYTLIMSAPPPHSRARDWVVFTHRHGGPVPCSCACPRGLPCSGKYTHTYTHNAGRSQPGCHPVALEWAEVDGWLPAWWRHLHRGKRAASPETWSLCLMRSKHCCVEPRGTWGGNPLL